MEVSVQPTSPARTLSSHQQPPSTDSHPLAPTSPSTASSSRHDQDDSDLAELLWSKSAVYLHPSPHSRDNVPGFLSLVRVRATDAHLVSWIPESLVEGTRDYDAYVLVELSSQNERDILVHLAPSFAVDAATAYSHAFSHPLPDLYSLRVEPPTLSSWVGSITLSLFGGLTLPPLFFHDDESKSTLLDRDARVTALGVGGSHSRQHGHGHERRASLAPSWGGEAFLAQVRHHARLVRSQLDSAVWLVNPSRDDLEAHVGPAAAAREDDDVPAQALQGVRARTSILHQSSPVSGGAKGKGAASSSAVARADTEWPDDPDAVVGSSRGGGVGGIGGRDDGGGMDALTFSVLSGFSRITRGARHMSQQAASTVLSHPLAKPLAKHVPTPIAQFALAPGEVSRLTDAAGVGVRPSLSLLSLSCARRAVADVELAYRSTTRRGSTSPSGRASSPRRESAPAGPSTASTTARSSTTSSASRRARSTCSRGRTASRGSGRGARGRPRRPSSSRSGARGWTARGGSCSTRRRRGGGSSSVCVPVPLPLYLLCVPSLTFVLPTGSRRRRGPQVRLALPPARLPLDVEPSRARRDRRGAQPRVRAGQAALDGG